MSDDYDIDEIKSLPLYDKDKSLLRMASKINEAVRAINKHFGPRNNAKLEMNNKTDAQESETTRWLFNPATTVTRPTQVFLALFTADPGEPGSTANEVLGTSGYVRENVIFVTPTQGFTNNQFEILFPIATSGYTVTHVGICKSNVRGTTDLMYYGALATPVVVGVGTQFRFGPGSVTVSEQGALSGFGGVIGGDSVLTGDLTLSPGVPGSTIDIALIFHRAKNSAVLNACGGILLQQGQLTAAQLGLCSVRIGGVEKRICIAAQNAVYLDNTLMSVYLEVQNPGALVGTDVFGVLSIGTTRTTTDIAPTGVIPYSVDDPQNSGFPDVIVAANDPIHLCKCDVAPETIPRSQMPLGADFQAWDVDWDTFEPTHWDQFGTYTPALNSNYVDLKIFANYYDRALIYFQMYRRRGSIEFYKKCCAFAKSYNEDYIHPNVTGAGVGVQPYFAFPWGIAVHYLITGDIKSKESVKGFADTFDIVYTNTIGTGNEDQRNDGRILLSFIIAYRFGFGASYLTRLNTLLDNIMNAPYWQPLPNSFYRVPDPSNCPAFAQTNFMHTILSHAFEMYYRWIAPDSRIPAKIKGTCDYLWTQWRPNDTPLKSFNYLSGFCPGEGDASRSEDLTLMFTTPFAWVARQFNDISYLSKADEIFANKYTGTVYLEKQFNQYFIHSPTYFKYRTLAQ